MEQPTVDHLEKTIPPVNQIDDDVDDDDSNGESMPPLETVEKTMNLGPDNKKNIVIPDDDQSKEKVNHESDDGDENNGYMDILNNGDLRKKTVKKGDNVRPQRGSKVIIRIETRLYSGGCDDDQDIGTGKLIEGETFDKLPLVIGDNDLHQGLDLLIPLMELHEVCRAIIKSRFTYGQLGNNNVDIPGDATLDCQIELLEILSPSDIVYGQAEDDESNSIANKETLDERLKFGNYKKTRGNFWFERGEYSMAIQCYKGALKYLDANNDELKLIDDDNKNKVNDQLELVDKIKDLIDKRAQTFNNLAASQMKMEAFDTALRSVNDSLLLRPNNVKALFRHAKILTEKGDVEDAIKDLKKAASIDPQSEAIAMELNRLNKILVKQINDQKALYRRMLQMETDDKDNRKQSKHSNCDNTGNQSIWYRFRWPAAISLGMVTAAAILIQSFVYSSAK